jgi:hypothetical protein
MKTSAFLKLDWIDIVLALLGGVVLSFLFPDGIGWPHFFAIWIFTCIGIVFGLRHKP